MKKILTLMLAIVATASVTMAQERTYGPYITGKWSDHIFVGLAGGVDGLHCSGNTPRIAPHFEFNVGKWFTPNIGTRVGIQGLSLAEIYGDANYYSHYWLDPDDENQYRHGFAYVHGDIMLNLINAVAGYEPRIFSVVPYIHTGYVRIWNYEAGIFSADHDNEWGLGPGILVSANLTKAIALTLDMRDVIFSGRFHNYNYGGRANAISTALGLSYTFGETGWTSAKTLQNSLADAEAALAAASAELASLKDANDDLNARVKALADENDALKAVPVEEPKNEGDVVYVKTALGISPITLYYDLDSPVLNVTERRHLDDYMKEVLAKDPERKFILTGSADKGTGTYEHNVKLAAKRSAGVKDILMNDYGVKSENISVNEGIVSDKYSDPRYDRAVYVEH